MWKAPHCSATRPSWTSSSRQSTRRAASAPYCLARSGTLVEIGLVVLAEVGGVGVRDGALARASTPPPPTCRARRRTAMPTRSPTGSDISTREPVIDRLLGGWTGWRGRGASRPERAPPTRRTPRTSSCRRRRRCRARRAARRGRAPSRRRGPSPGGVRSTTRLPRVRDLDHPLAQHPAQVVVGRDAARLAARGWRRPSSPPGIRTLIAPSSSRSRRHGGLGGDDALGGEQLDELAPGW